MSANLDRFSQVMPWEKKQEPMYDLCLDCGKEISFGKSYCRSCQDRIDAVEEVERELIYLQEKCKKVVSSLEFLATCSRTNAAEHREMSSKSQDSFENSFERGIKAGMAIAYDILALRAEEIKKELQEAAN